MRTKKFPEKDIFFDYGAIPILNILRKGQNSELDLLDYLKDELVFLIYNAIKDPHWYAVQLSPEIRD